MAMLAEKKRKQRWSLNPRGNSWMEDSNKFGQKMLEKMGWKHGKGLGANEDGIKEHLKVSHKNDCKGMGFKEVEGWTEHEANFSALLNNLSKTSGVELSHHSTESVSLEEMSQKSRVRVHYHKFMKGKDLSRYSEKDLASIFGKKYMMPYKDIVHVGKDEKFVKKGCMVDYFKKKLPNFSLNTNGYNIGSDGVLQKEFKGLQSERCGFGYQETISNITVSSLQEIVFDEAVHSKQNRKRKLEEIAVKCDNNTEIIVGIDEIIKSEKKERPKDNIKDEVNQEQNSLLEEDDEIVEKSKKSHKAKIKKSEGTFVSYLNEDVSLENNEDELKIKEKKRRKSNLQSQVHQDENSMIDSNKASEDEKKKEKIRKMKPKEAKTVNTTSMSCVNNDNFKNDGEVYEILEEKSRSHKYDLQCKVEKNNEVKQDAYFTEENTSKAKSRKKKKFETEESVNGENTYVKTSKDAEQKLEKGKSITEENTYIKYSKDAEDKSGKKKRHKNHIQGEDDENDEACQDVHFSEENTPKTKSRKKKKLETEESVNEENTNVKTSKNAEQDTEFKNILEKKSKISKREKTPKKKTMIENCEIILKSQTTNKKQKQNINVNDEGISNPAFDPLFSNIVIKKHALDTIVESEETFINAENETSTNEKRKKQKKLSAPANDSLNKIEEVGIDNPTFNPCIRESNVTHVQDNLYEVKTKEKKKKRNIEIDNFGTVNNDHEIKVKSKKRRLNDEFADIDNPGFEMNAETNESIHGNFEGKRKEKKQKSKRKNDDLALDNPGFQLESEKETEDSIQIDEELLLNVVSLPVIETVEINTKHRKSVTFNDVVAQKIIPSNETPHSTQNRNGLFDINHKILRNGIDNIGYDRRANNIEENVAYMSRTFDRFHAEVENDINEAKVRRSFNSGGRYIGEPGDPSERHVKLVEGTRLGFKGITFGKAPIWMRKQKGDASPKKSYRHLIRGDIIVKFKDANLHEITGYATAPCST